MQAEVVASATPRADPLDHAHYEPEVTVNEHSDLADRANLTGADEWDEVELAETDPSREPIPEEFLKGLI